MYYNVVVKRSVEFFGGDSLVFHFNENLSEALDFAQLILLKSDYHVEILQFENKEEE